MVRQRVLVAALVACVSTAALMAIERATFILTDGERVSGTVVFHTDARANFRPDTREWSVGLNDGREQAIKDDHVAVIDFVGGKPKQAELEALPPQGRHMLAMRDGSNRMGRLVDLIGGDTVRWRSGNGDTQDIPIREVSRIYMNSDSARIAFDYTPSPATKPAAAAGPTTTAVPVQRQAAATTRATVLNRIQPGAEIGSVDLQGQTNWIDTGITVRAGDRLSFTATGTVYPLLTTGSAATPDGNAQMRSQTYPVGSLGAGGLIGKVGNGQAFAIGSSQSPIDMPASGRLMLGINDDDLHDNSGTFKVVIKRG